MRSVPAALLALLVLVMQQQHAGAQTVKETGIPVPNFAKQPQDCKAAAQAVWCYYDAGRTAIIGLAYQPRATSFSRRVCSTTGTAPGTYFSLRPNVGVKQVESTTCNGRVVRLAFKLTNGNIATCKATGSPCCWRGETCKPPASGKPRPAWTDPVQIFVGPTTPDKKPYWMAGMQGTCAKVTNSLERLSEVCWVKPPSRAPPPPPVSPSPPPVRPSPSPSPPPPSPSPSPPPPPAAGSAQLSVTLFARGQSSCGSLTATTSLTNWLNNQLVMLQLADYRVQWDDTSCSCSLDPDQQNTPMYRCLYTVRGPQLDYLNATEVAPYLADVISASGQQFCSSAPVVPGFCGGAPAITGYCAVAPESSSSSSLSVSLTSASSSSPGGQLTCALLPVPQPAALQATLAVPGASCNRSRVLSDAEAASLVSYMGGFVPGFSLSLAAPSAPLVCSRAQGNAYYAVPMRLSAGIRTDVRGAAAYLSDTLNEQQPAPCQPGSGNAGWQPDGLPPAFCTGFPTPPVLCATTSGNPADPYQCSGAGASFAVVFSNPDDSCAAGNPPPAAYAASLDPWWRMQLDSFQPSYKACSATTVAPGTATANTAKGYCNYSYRVAVTCPVEYSAKEVADAALVLMSNSFAYRPVPCVYFSSYAFCQYFQMATFCAATPYMPDYPLDCSPEAPPTLTGNSGGGRR